MCPGDVETPPEWAPKRRPPTLIDIPAPQAIVQLMPRDTTPMPEINVADPPATADRSTGGTGLVRGMEQARIGPGGRAPIAIPEQRIGPDQPAPEAPPAPPVQQQRFAPGYLVKGGPQVTGWQTHEEEGVRPTDRETELREQSYLNQQASLAAAQERDRIRAQAEAKAASDAALAERQFAAKQAQLYADAERHRYDTIDPDKVLGDTGVRIGSALAMALGAFGATIGHSPNYAMDIVQKRIDTNMALEANRLRQEKMGRDDMAVRLAAYREAQLGAVKAKLGDLMQSANSPDAQARGSAMIAQLQSQQADQERLTNTLAQGKVSRSTNVVVRPDQYVGGGPVGGASAEVDPDLVVPSLGGAAQSKEQAKEYRERDEAAQRAIQLAAFIEEKTKGKAWISGEEKSRVEAARLQLQTVLPKAYGVGAREQHLFHEQFQRAAGEGEEDPTTRLHHAITGAAPLAATVQMLEAQRADMRRNITPMKQGLAPNKKGEIARSARWDPNDPRSTGVRPKSAGLSPQDVADKE